MEDIIKELVLNIKYLEPDDPDVRRSYAKLKRLGYIYDPQLKGWIYDTDKKEDGFS